MASMGATKTILAAALIAAGCGGGSAATPDAGQGPLYVISTGVSTGDDFVGYLVTVPSLDATTTFNLDGAQEVEPSWIFTQPGTPYVFAASLFTPTIDRYVAKDDGSLEKDKTVSFANLGVQSAYLAASAPIYSAEKSYFVDDVQDQIVIWNPKEMTIVGTIPLGDKAEGALPPAAEGTIVVHDGLIITEIHWSDPNDDPSLYGTHVRLVAVDPATDEIVKVTDDDRLTYASPMGRASDGAIYYSPGSFIAAEAVVGAGHGSPSRLLRLGAKDHAFDAAYALDLSTLVGGRSAGDFVLLDDQNALIRAWHPDLVDAITPENWKDVLWTQAGFMWWRWHVGDAQAVQIPNQSPGALGSAVFSLDGKTYVMRTAADSTTTTLDEIDAQGDFHPKLSGPGQFIGNSVIRVR